MVSNIFKRVLVDIMVYFPGKLLPALTGLITIPIFARLFDPSEYGVLALIGMFTAVGGIAVGSWLTASVIRFLSYYRKLGQLDHFYSTLLSAFLLSLAVLAAIFIPLYFFIEGTVSVEVHRLLPLGGIIIAVSTLFAILQTVLRADQRSSLFVGFELFQVYGALALGLILVIALGFGVEGILLGSLAALTTSCIGILWWLTRQGVKLSMASFSRATLREFAVYGLPGGVATIGTWLLSLSDRYIIELYRGTTEVGLYSMGYSIADKSINLVVSSLMLAVSPILISTWESHHRESTPELLGQITRLTLLLIIPMVAGISTLAVPVLKILATEAYLPGAIVLPWVSLGALLYGLSLQAYTGLIIAKKTVVMARNYILAGAVNVLMNIVLVPRFGFVVAAVNTAVAYGLLLAMNVLSANRYFPWLFPWRSLWNGLLASGGMVLMIVGMMTYAHQGVLVLALTVLAGMVVYLALLIALREFRSEEIQMLKEMVPSKATFSKIRKSFSVTGRSS